MPEDIEFEPPSPHETAHEAPAADGRHALVSLQHGWARFVPLSTAMLAVMAAIAALESSTLVNEALLEQSKAVQYQAQASDAWAYFQAKGIKANSAAQTADVLAANAGQSAKTEEYRSEMTRHRQEQRELETRARELERQRDERTRESDHFMHRHHPFAYCVTLTQIAIALSAIAALTHRRAIWHASMALGLVGLVMFLIGFGRA